jgi:hypothetical protein
VKEWTLRLGILRETRASRTGLIARAANGMKLGTENLEVTEEQDEQGQRGQEDCAQNLRAIRFHGALA